MRTNSKEREAEEGKRLLVQCVFNKNLQEKTCDKGKKYNKGNGSTFGEIYLFLLYFSKKTIPLKTKYLVKTLTEQNRVGVSCL